MPPEAATVSNPALNPALSRVLQTVRVKEVSKNKAAASQHGSYGSILSKARQALSNAKKKVHNFFVPKDELSEDEEEEQPGPCVVGGRPGTFGGLSQRYHDTPTLDKVQSFNKSRDSDQDPNPDSGIWQSDIALARKNSQTVTKALSQRSFRADGTDIGRRLLKSATGTRTSSEDDTPRILCSPVGSSSGRSVNGASTGNGRRSSTGPGAIEGEDTQQSATGRRLSADPIGLGEDRSVGSWMGSNAPAPLTNLGESRRRRLSTLLSAEAAASLQALYSSVDSDKPEKTAQRSKPSQTRAQLPAHEWRGGGGGGGGGGGRRASMVDYRSGSVKPRRRSLAFTEVDNPVLYAIQRDMHPSLPVVT